MTCFRTAMKHFERIELLEAAQATADALSVPPADVPIEGYYTEDDQLTRYFRLVRALQAVPKHRESELTSHDGFARLQQVTRSHIFGPAAEGDFLLPTGDDCLAAALNETFPAWTIPTITDRAYEVAIQSDDISLVALAALSRDPVVLTALRESVVLYATVLGGSARTQEPEYIWQVDRDVTDRASLFVQEFNELFDATLPAPTADNAQSFWVAGREWKVLGRCVRIGFDDRVEPTRHYHWAIETDSQSDLNAREFWDTELWTTARYRETHEQRL